MQQLWIMILFCNCELHHQLTGLPWEWETNIHYGKPVENLWEFPFGNPVGISKCESSGTKNPIRYTETSLLLKILTKYNSYGSYYVVGIPMGILWESCGNSHMGFGGNSHRLFYRNENSVPR